MTANELLFSLISAEICENKTVNYNKKPDEETLNKLYKTAKAHDVAHIVCNALEKQGFLDNGEISAKFRKKKLVALYRTEQIVYDCEGIYRVLEENGVDFLPLKGAVIRNLYPEKWMRTSCDIDVLVRKEECDRAASILCEKLGFTVESGKTLHDIQLLSPTGVALELHYTLMEDDCMPRTAQYLGDVWNDAAPTDGYKHRYEMSKEMFMLYNVAHMAKHVIRGGCGIKSFMDLYILENKLSFEQEKLGTLLDKAAVKTFYESAKKLCRVWFENDKHDETSKELEKFVLDGGVYGTAANGAAMRAGKGESKAKSFMENAFLSYDALCVVYPKLKGRKMLYPIYQIKRWFRIFNKDKRKKISDLTTIRNKVSEEKQKKAERLLNSLGLE